MPNLSVAMIGPVDYAKDLGKKGTSTDITLFDMKRDLDTVSLIEPTKYPDRLASLYYACAVADAALVVVEEINAQFGECVLMLDVMGIKKGYLVLKNFIAKEQIVPLIKVTVVEGYEVLDDDPVKIRERLLEDAAKQSQAEEGRGSVPIDHHFNVKGVGTVVLGFVAKGTIKKHETLQVLPTKKEALVRSIQKHDDDFDTATRGDRVGLALKGIESEELDRGFVLSNDSEIKGESRILGPARLVKYWPSPLKEGMVLHIGHWMQFMPAKVVAVQNGSDWRQPTLELVMEKDLVHQPKTRAALCYLDGGKLRVVGSIALA